MSSFKLSFPKAWGGVAGKATFKAAPEQFKVFEQLKFTPEGQGEHLYIYLEKRNHNTQWVCRTLAKWFGVMSKDIGYAGLKDRLGVTRQWISIWLPGKDCDHQKLTQFLLEQHIDVLEITRHTKKLKIGALTGNQFEVHLLNFSGCSHTLHQRLSQLINEGFPNWFGEQRFGHNLSNLTLAEAWLKPDSTIKKLKKDSRRFAISAARSWIFNQILTQRVLSGTWNQRIPGEVLIFKDNQSVIVPERFNQSADEKWQQGELHPSGPLWGCGNLLSQDKARHLELFIANQTPILTKGLEQKVVVTQNRRPLRQWVRNLQYQWQENDITLSFFLPKGTFATALLKELINYTDQN